MNARTVLDTGVPDELDEQPVLLIVRLACEQPSASDIAKLQEACRRYLRAGGSVPLERCLGVPATFTEFRRACRDHYLCRAARQLLRDDPAAKCRHLHEHWRKFARDGRYAQWRDDADPPDWASEFSKYLFFATRYARQEGSASHADGVLTKRHLSRVVGHVFRRKCPRV